MPFSHPAFDRAHALGTRALRPAQPGVRAFQLWMDADGLRMSAAMSFYGVLSLAPLLVLLVAVLGWWLDRSYVETELLDQITAVIGPRGADGVRQALASAQKPSDGIVASAIAFALLLFGATGVFAELQSAFERVWQQGRPPAPPSKWWYAASLRLRGVGYILAFGFLLMVSLVITTVLEVVSGWAGAWLPLEPLLRILNQLIAFAFCTALFAGMMRLSTGPKPSLRYMVMGGAIGATLFTVGKYVLALYLSRAALVSAYGAAGSLVVLLMWIYFSSAILLLSAGCARALSDAAAEAALREREKEQAVEAAVAATDASAGPTVS
ncbi:YihY/virulence factor BrkB family protein [Xylophilus sp. Leaf220]|uniref:YihY/virulence factor BrkB family protein n=1 Tax=Xylophilus sp. Leaf220 TaxID=1735686 RepID=UPI0009EBCEB0|nr:YihY/virulence factor BrkB family protein [Xylophilus sp. Leaf220]